MQQTADILTIALPVLLVIAVLAGVGWLLFADADALAIVAVFAAVGAALAFISLLVINDTLDEARQAEQQEACFRADGHWHVGACFPEPSFKPWESATTTIG